MDAQMTATEENEFLTICVRAEVNLEPGEAEIWHIEDIEIVLLGTGSGLFVAMKDEFTGYHTADPIDALTELIFALS